MKYNALRAPCDAKVTLTSDIPTFRDKKAGGCTSSCDFGSLIRRVQSLLSQNL